MNSYTDHVDGPGDYLLDLPNVPVVSLTSVTLEANGAVPEVISGTNYILDQKRGRIRLKDTATGTRWFRPGFQNIAVTYSAGYASIPPDLQQACAMVAQQLFIQRGANLLVTQERLGDYQATYSRAQQVISEAIDVQQVLNRYRDWSKLVA